MSGLNERDREIIEARARLEVRAMAIAERQGPPELWSAGPAVLGVLVDLCRGLSLALAMLHELRMRAEFSGPDPTAGERPAGP